MKIVPTMSSIKCIIFDCDGVLVDSEPISAEILIEELASVGVHVDHAYVQHHFLGRSWVKIAAEMRSAHNLDLDDAFEAKYRERLLSAFETELNATEGIGAILQQINVPICVATSSSPRRAARSLEIVGLSSFFEDCVFTASEVKKGKPAPDLFLHAAHKMQVAPENCLVVEDSLPGLKAAKAAGMECVRYMGGSHLKGQLQASQIVMPHIAHFDKWENFFSIAPDLTT